MIAYRASHAALFLLLTGGAINPVGERPRATRSFVALKPAGAVKPPQASSPEAFKEIRRRAIATRSDAVRIWQNGRPVFAYDAPDAPAMLTPQSIVKAIVALAVLKLVDDGKLESLDQPVYTLYPEWRQGRKKLITVRHLLTHTSGLQNEPNVQAELVHLPDRVQAALTAELQEDPGKQ